MINKNMIIKIPYNTFLIFKYKKLKNKNKIYIKIKKVANK